MNGARSIFMRKGYWLTALAAIVLLAASPGTAYGAERRVRGNEFHDDGGRIPRCNGTPAPITIDINVSGLTAPSEGDGLDWRPEKVVLECSRSCTTQTLRTLAPGERLLCAWVSRPADLVRWQELSHR